MSLKFVYLLGCWIWLAFDVFSDASSDASAVHVVVKMWPRTDAYYSWICVCDGLYLQLLTDISLRQLPAPSSNLQEEPGISLFTSPSPLTCHLVFDPERSHSPLPPHVTPPWAWEKCWPWWGRQGAKPPHHPPAARSHQLKARSQEPAATCICKSPKFVIMNLILIHAVVDKS